jgi:hypothetical protein
MGKKQSTLGRERRQWSWENRENLYGGYMKFLHIHLGTNNKEGIGKITLDLEEEFWANLAACQSILEHIGAKN